MDVEPNYNQLRQTYSSQLEQMREFGFVDDEENIRALIVCKYFCFYYAMVGLRRKKSATMSLKKKSWRNIVENFLIYFKNHCNIMQEIKIFDCHFFGYMP